MFHQLDLIKNINNTDYYMFIDGDQFFQKKHIKQIKYILSLSDKNINVKFYVNQRTITKYIEEAGFQYEKTELNQKDIVDNLITDESIKLNNVIEKDIPFVFVSNDRFIENLATIISPTRKFIWWKHLHLSDGKWINNLTNNSEIIF